MHKQTSETLNKLIENKLYDAEEVKSYANILRENSEKSHQQFIISFSSFLIISITWILIKSSLVTNFKFYDFEFKDINILLLFLPILASFTLYKSISLLLLCTCIDEILFEFYEKIYPNLKSLDATYFLPPPSFESFDMFINDRASKTIVSKILNQIWFVFLVISFFLIPIILIGWMVIYSFQINSVVSIIIGLINVMFLIRIITISLNTSLSI